jgi:3-hydroxyisobutyrate dehydrogenase
MRKVALIGLGIMGSGMAGRLAPHCELAVYNRRREAADPFRSQGVRIAESPRDAATGAEMVLSMVADDQASHSVWLGDSGALAGVAPGTPLIECSTVSPDWITELADAAAKRDCQLLDAPVTGTKPHAAAGQLLFLVGGDASVLDSVRPILSLMGRAVMHLGPVGSGARMKLINNFVCAVQTASLAEGLVLAERCGVKPEIASEVLSNGAPGSPLVKTLAGRMLAGNYEPNFLLRLMQKDVSYAVALAAKSGLALNTAAAAGDLFQQAIENGLSEKDFSAVVESVRKPFVISGGF